LSIENSCTYEDFEAFRFSLKPVREKEHEPGYSTPCGERVLSF
jgi:hypothetical protein